MSLLEIHREDTYKGEGGVRIETEIGMMWPQPKEDKECLEPPETGKSKEPNLPVEPLDSM